jgi:pyrimidine deaminase RibD-like protein
MKFSEFKKSDYEIHDQKFLDTLLLKLCKAVVQGQEKDPELYGVVASGVLDPDRTFVMGINEADGNGTRKHGERVAMENYEKKYGEIPAGSIILTTCSPCNEDDTEMAAGRYGESCTDLINNSNVRKVYCGYMDPSQQDMHNKYTLECTTNQDIHRLCEQFASRFLEKTDIKEFAHAEPQDDDGDVPPNIYKLANRWWNNTDDQDRIAMVLRSMGWDIQQADGEEDVCQLTYRDGTVYYLNDSEFDPDLYENFADGKHPGRKGLAKRSGVNTKASVSSLRKTAKHSTGEKQRMAHWLANMKAGRAKKK